MSNDERLAALEKRVVELEIALSLDLERKWAMSKYEKEGPVSGVFIEKLALGMFSELIGKVVTEFRASPDRSAFGFQTACGLRQAYKCTADCCSVSWVNHISGVSSLPFVLESVEERNFGRVAGTRQEEDQVDMYCFIGRDKQGWRHGFQLEFRNSSNGYYGGRIEPDPLNDWSALTHVGKDF